MTNNGKIPDWWDPYSCQPYKLEKAEKPRSSVANLIEYCKIAATTVALLPAILLRYATLNPGQAKKPDEIAGLSISTDPQWFEAQRELVDELGIRNLLIRLSSWELNRLESIRQYLDSFPDCHFVINILQDKQSVIDETAWAHQVDCIFICFADRCDTFKIGNAINRSKWGCGHSGDAISLFKIADRIRQDKYPQLKLLGSSVIDFEPLITLRTLFNFAQYRFDGCASLLYINRRGSAYGKQYGIFNLRNKLRLTKSILSLSNNTKNELWITETNWPLLNTKPYTPNSGHPRSTVDEQTQAEYLKQYFTIAAQTGWVERAYWWQLINPGYGLVDHRSGELRKMPSFYAFKDFLKSEIPNENQGTS